MLEGEKIGPFLIQRELGSGAMGTVYLADFHQDDKVTQVAFKMIAMGLTGNDSAMARFDREANILKQLKHPHIVRLLGTGRYKKTPFIAMEYVDGEPLDRQLLRRGRLPWETVVDYAKQLCEALQHAHEKGIIHRDLKPSNLMLTKEGVLKLTDFGIAKDTDVTALTGANSTIGTAAYMSPEQCKGDKFISNKSDLYSLGIVLYELLTGKKPFIAEGTVDMFMKHVTETPTRPAKIIHDIPVWLDNLVMFLMEKDKDRRPLDAATVERMLTDIENKVQAQMSAGEVAAASKKSSRTLHGQMITEEDKEAARAIKGKKKKKKKADSEPWFKQTWFKAIAFGLGFLVVGGGIMYGLTKKKSDPETIADAGSGSGTTENPKNQANDKIEKKEVKKVTETDLEGAKWETVLHNRFNSRFNFAQEGEDEGIYSNFKKAMDSEIKGDLGRSKEIWGEILRKTDTANDINVSKWKWVAKKRIADHENVEVKFNEIRKKLNSDFIEEKPFQYDISDPTSNAILAVKYEQFGDHHSARKIWREQLEELKKKPQHWVVYLMASKQLAGIPKDEQINRQAIIDNLEKNMVKWKNDCEKPLDDLVTDKALMRSCRNFCREVVDLYGKEQGDKIFDGYLTQAKAWLERMIIK